MWWWAVTRPSHVRGPDSTFKGLFNPCRGNNSLAARKVKSSSVSQIFSRRLADSRVPHPGLPALSATLGASPTSLWCYLQIGERARESVRFGTHVDGNRYRKDDSGSSSWKGNTFRQREKQGVLRSRADGWVRNQQRDEKLTTGGLILAPEQG